MNTMHGVDEQHLSSFVSSFVSALAERVDYDATELTAGKKSPFGIIGAWTPEAPTV